MKERHVDVRAFNELNVGQSSGRSLKQTKSAVFSRFKLLQKIILIALNQERCHSGNQTTEHVPRDSSQLFHARRLLCQPFENYLVLQPHGTIHLVILPPCIQSRPLLHISRGIVDCRRTQGAHVT